MAKLLLCLEGVVLREFPLERDTLCIGRKAQNEIQIDDITISSKHAIVKVEKMPSWIMSKMCTSKTWTAPTAPW